MPDNLPGFKLYTDMMSRRLQLHPYKSSIMHVIFHLIDAPLAVDLLSLIDVAGYARLTVSTN